MTKPLKKTVSILLAVIMIFSVFTIIPVTASAATTAGYYLVGYMTNWQPNDAYMFTRNEGQQDYEEYMILNQPLQANEQIKVAHTSNGTSIDQWFPDEAGSGLGNKRIETAGNYNIYFRPDGRGGADWYGGYFYVQQIVVAKVNNTEYGTFKDALAAAGAAGNGATVTLFADCTLDEQVTLPATADVTVDFNGKKVTVNVHKGIVNNGKLTLCDSTNADGGMHGTGKGGLVDSTGTLIVNSGKYTSENNNDGANNTCAFYIHGTGSTATVNGGTVDTVGFPFYVYTNGQITVNAGTLHSEKQAAVSGNGNPGNGGYVINIAGGLLSSDDDVAIYHPNNGTLNITGGSMTGPTAIYIKSGTTSVTGAGTNIGGDAVISATGAETPYSYNGSGCNPTGDAIVVENCGYPGGKPAIAISGGNITSANAKPVGTYASGTDTNGNANQPVKNFISGGTFNKPVPEELCAEGYVPKANGNTYSVWQHTHDWDYDHPVWGDNFAGGWWGYTVDVTLNCKNGDCTKTVTANSTGFTEETPPSCIEQGYTSGYFTATVDGHELMSEEMQWDFQPVVSHIENTWSPAHKAAKAATYNADGNIEYWICSGCGKYFTDAQLTQEVDPEDVVIPMLTGAKAQVGETKYGTFAEAVEAANGSLIKILAKDDTPYVMSVNQTIVTDNYTKITIVAPDGAYAVKRTYSSADKTYTFTVINAVASMTTGGTTKYYGSLGDAVSAAPNAPTSATVELLSDSTELAINVGSATVKKNVVIDLGGNTLTLNRNYEALFIIRNGSTAVVKNGDVVFNTLNANASGFVVQDNGSTLTLANDLDVVATGNTAGVYVKNGTLTSAADITAANSFAIATNGSKTSNAAINITGGVLTSNTVAVYLPGAAATTISGGTMTGATAVYAKSGTLSITGGTFNGTGAAADYTYNGNGANATGDAIVVDSCGYPGGAPTVTISGNPTIASENGVQIGDYTYQANPAANVTATSNALTLPEGLKWVETETEGVYEVGIDYAAEVNGTGYMTFEEAVAARNGNEDTEIKLLKNYSGTYTMAPGKLVVDKNGFTFKTPSVEGAYLVGSTNSGTVYTFTTTEAAIEYTSLAGVVSYKSNIDYSNMGSSGTYKLLKDITTGSRIVPGRFASNVTVDLNGHTLTSNATDNCFLISRNGSANSHNTFVITDTSTNGGGKIIANQLANTGTSNTAAVISATSAATYNDITISNVTIETTQGIGLLGNNQSLTIDNSTITVTGNDFALATNGSKTNGAVINVTDSSITSTNGIAVYLPGGSTATFTDTNVTGTTAMYIKSGETTITGGTYTATGAQAPFNHNGNGANATGDAIVVESCNYPNGVPTVSIGANSVVVTDQKCKQVGDYTYTPDGQAEATAPANVTANSNALTLPFGLQWVPTETQGVYTVGQKLFLGYTLSLNGYIDFNFYLNPELVEDGDTVNFSWDRGDVDYTLDEEKDYTKIPGTDYYGYKATVSMPAAEMTYDVTASVNGFNETDTCSVYDCGKKYLASSNEDLVNLVKTMLDYGAKAQTVFKRNITKLANAGIDYSVPVKTKEQLKNLVAASIEGGSASDLNAVATQLNADYYTTSLIFLSGNTLRHYFTPKAGGSLNKNDFDGVKSDNYYYYFEVKNIPAAQLDKQQTFGKNGVTFNYSALDYVMALLEKSAEGSDNYNLAEATYWYNAAANAYFEGGN